MGAPGSGETMRAVVTRGGELAVGTVDDPSPGPGHVVVRSLGAGICGSDLHALADFPHFAELMARVGAPALDLPAQGFADPLGR